jgi:hypothetical protein
MLANEVRVTLDVSAVRSIDGLGLEAVLRLICAIHTFGGTVIFDSEPTLGEMEAALRGALGRHSLDCDRQITRVPVR